MSYQVFYFEIPTRIKRVVSSQKLSLDGYNPVMPGHLVSVALLVLLKFYLGFSGITLVSVR